MTPEILLLGIRLLIAAALYAFLGAVIWMQWRQLTGSSSEADEIPSAHLLMMDGGQGGQRLLLRQTTDVGRAIGNAIRLPDKSVSAQHARISFQGGQWWVEDFASRNGTLVNGVQVNEPLVVTYGDEIRFGRTVSRLERGDPAGTPDPTANRSDVGSDSRDERIASESEQSSGGQEAPS
ncbi:MAG: FHA domain-containing protein [Anaerolineales bacterium]